MPFKSLYYIWFRRGEIHMVIQGKSDSSGASYISQHILLKHCPNTATPALSLPLGSPIGGLLLATEEGAIGLEVVCRVWNSLYRRWCPF